MGYFYFDESISEKGDFIIGAFIYCKEVPDEEVSLILSKNGYNPQEVEFKSSLRFSDSPQMKNVRRLLKEMLINRWIRIAVVIIPKNKRNQLGKEAIKGLRIFLRKNKLHKEKHNIYFDEGVLSSDRWEKYPELKLCNVYPKNNSVIIKGVQIADLVAHSCQIILSEKLGLINKKIKAGEDSGYDPDTLFNIGFELWADIRHLFFNKDIFKLILNRIKKNTFKVEPYGLYISEGFNSKTLVTIRECFSSMYLGCIH